MRNNFDAVHADAFHFLRLIARKDKIGPLELHHAEKVLGAAFADAAQQPPGRRLKAAKAINVMSLYHDIKKGIK